MQVPSPFRSYPPGWATFDAFAQAPGPTYFRLHGSVADVNRFAARYRAAKCFRGIEFDELTSSIAQGYEALVQLLLTYSAFEHFMRCLGTRLQASHTLLADAERDRTLANLRRLQGQRELFAVLRQHLDPPYQRQVDVHLRNGACNPLYLAAGIRHAFAHGKLAAAPVGIPESAVATVSRFFCRVLMRIMDREFSQRVIEFEQMLAEDHE